MAVYVYPKIDADQLLDRLMAWIDSEEGSPTWALRESQIVHTADSGQWDEGAYLALEAKRHEKNPCLVFYYKIVKGRKPRTGTYGVYNGRFVQMLLNHFTADIAHVSVKDLRNQ